MVNIRTDHLLFGSNFERVDLDGSHDVWLGRLSATVAQDAATFEALWRLRPTRYTRIRMGGRWVDTPRWQQAYGADYRYTGQINRALPVHEHLEPFARFARESIDPRLNGLLLNWYDATLGHYIGRHRDKPHDLVPDVPIVTISLGATRTFRLRPWKSTGKIDLLVDNGAVVIIPRATNQAWTHEVPLFAKDEGRRISVTIRAFERTRSP